MKTPILCLLISACILTSCAQKEMHIGVCRHSAFYAASILSEHHPDKVKIEISSVGFKNLPHAQAVVVDGTDKRYFKVVNGWAVESERDKISREIIRTVTLDEYLQERKKWR